MALLGLGCGSSAEMSQPSDLTKNPYVHAQGTALLDGQNQPLELRGIALGGWLYHESWMTNFDYQTWERVLVEAEAQGHGADAHAVIRSMGSNDGNNLDRVAPALATKLGAASAQKIIDAVKAWPTLWGDGEAPLYAALDRRYGPAGRKQVVSAFHDSWLKEADLAAIADLGFNTVRIATGWRDLVEVTGDKQPKAPLVFDEEGFRRLETLLDWCEKYGLYGVMDLQDSPGGHNGVTGRRSCFIRTRPRSSSPSICGWRLPGV
jgi:aryl-phospho-beta-D-glucosidase BglC (GH1 family)